METGQKAGGEVSILIKGIHIPTGCAFCFYNRDSRCLLLPGLGCDETNGAQRRENCPLIELPDHGDLIDRDALNVTDSWEWIRHDAPVIIPAERSEDEHTD